MLSFFVFLFFFLFRTRCQTRQCKIRGRSQRLAVSTVAARETFRHRGEISQTTCVLAHTSWKVGPKRVSTDRPWGTFCIFLGVHWQDTVTCCRKTLKIEFAFRKSFAKEKIWCIVWSIFVRQVEPGCSHSQQHCNPVTSHRCSLGDTDSGGICLVTSQSKLQ